MWISIRTPIFAVFLTVVAFTNPAYAGCDSHHSGPVGKESPYYYSSSCFQYSDTRVRMTNKVCSVSDSTVVFEWSKLNWVSGASGVEFGGCIKRDNYSRKAVELGGSVITTNVAPEEVTDVYVPDLGEGNHVYFEQVEGGGPRVGSGTPEPFYFRILYEPKGETDVRIEATMVGESPVFFFVMPDSIKTEDDLKEYIGSDYINKIVPLVDFSGNSLYEYTSNDDTLVLAYYDRNETSDRANIKVESEKKRASTDFVVSKPLVEVVTQTVICLGQQKQISTCFQGPLL